MASNKNKRNERIGRGVGGIIGWGLGLKIGGIGIAVLGTAFGVPHIAVIVILILVVAWIGGKIAKK